MTKYAGLYQGLVSSGLAAAIQIWTISKGGPVLASIYLPLQTLLVALMASIVFGEEFFLGGWVLTIQATSISFCFLKLLPDGKICYPVPLAYATQLKKSYCF